MVLHATLVVLQLIYLEGILSLDNAVVLATMVAHLPRTEPIPWPRWLRRLQAPAHRLLGGQRTAALKVGLLGAYVGRGVMLAAATFVIHNRWLMLLGGLFLIKLAVDYLSEPVEVAEPTVPGTPVPRRAVQRSFWSVVLAVEVADLIFSLDNVVAAIGLSRDLLVISIGVGLGILAMRFASNQFGHLLDRYPILEGATYIIVLLIGIEVCVEELFQLRAADWVMFLFSLGTLIFCLWYASSRTLQRVLRPLAPLQRLLGVVSALFGFPLRLLAWLSAVLLAALRVIMLLASTRPRHLPPKH